MSALVLPKIVKKIQYLPFVVCVCALTYLRALTTFWADYWVGYVRCSFDVYWSILLLWVANGDESNKVV